MPTSVSCARCGKQSRINTMYERGRDTLAPVTAHAADTPPF